MELGIKGTAETVVVYENTAAAVGSGALEVFSTPSMIALMEGVQRTGAALSRRGTEHRRHSP